MSFAQSRAVEGLTEPDNSAPSSKVDLALSVRGLRVKFEGQTGGIIAVNDLSLSIGKGEMVAVVGESGSGKTTLTNAILGLLGSNEVDGSIKLGPAEVINANKEQLRNLRRFELATILQDPVGSLNPVRTIGSQLAESARAAGIAKGSLCDEAVAKVLADVGLDKAVVSRRLPHELSGGMNQRVAIAMALLKQPRLLIADEATSALDVRTQASVVALLQKVSAEHGAAVLLVTHDIGLALQACDRVAVMYAGRLVEVGQASALLTGARHPYTQALLAATPRYEDRHQRATAIPGTFEVSRPGDQGCPFRNRCPVRQDRCDTSFPAPSRSGVGDVWCWNASENA
ncbi:ABC transporter ATP-binding protein [Paenarthrobacter histidinolovorans]|uniref:ABC transporter ATP-binding protein n=1 Tax=Paenarthrobacter histidinolovorans TaxID=43664 RepID=UPI00166D3F31|nr:ABC transporter ATP-binding protein [Paenarthrobacter histidinolovorans]GGJ40373.1 ABC transporter ATP-binding protein [Paenarthrobacter histidinolovorans]